MFFTLKKWSGQNRTSRTGSYASDLATGVYVQMYLNYSCTSKTKLWQAINRNIVIAKSQSQAIVLTITQH